jgi:membrane-associated phospholipid phosphatase
MPASCSVERPTADPATLDALAKNQPRLRAQPLFPGPLPRPPLHLGVLAIVAGVWVFIEIADEVHEDDRLSRLDGAIAQWLHAHATQPLTQLIRLVTTLGDPLLVLPVALIIASVWWWQRRRVRALLLAAVVPGGLLLNTALKHLFTRARPEWEQPLGAAHGFSFPSGHVAGATLLYGTLALLWVRRSKTWPARAAAIAVPIFLIVAVSFSRLYLGVHYLTDVLAAQSVAWAWIALCVTALDTLRRRHAIRTERAP